MLLDYTDKDGKTLRIQISHVGHKRIVNFWVLTRDDSQQFGRRTVASVGPITMSADEANQLKELL